MNDNTLIKVDSSKQAEKVLDYLESQGFNYASHIDRTCLVTTTYIFKYIGIYKGEIRHCAKYSELHMNCEIIPYCKFRIKSIWNKIKQRIWLKS